MGIHISVSERHFFKNEQSDTAISKETTDSIFCQWLRAELSGENKEVGKLGLSPWT